MWSRSVRGIQLGYQPSFLFRAAKRHLLARLDQGPARSNGRRLSSLCELHERHFWRAHGLDFVFQHAPKSQCQFVLIDPARFDADVSPQLALGRLFTARHELISSSDQHQGDENEQSFPDANTPQRYFAALIFIYGIVGCISRFDFFRSC